MLKYCSKHFIGINSKRPDKVVTGDKTEAQKLPVQRHAGRESEALCRQHIL